MTRQELLDRLKKGPLILDGATGSNLMKAGMPKGICTEKWVADHPDILIKLQQDYVEAGSDIIYAPTFMANRVSLREHGLADETESLNKTLVSLSRTASGGRALVAGDLTTTGKMMEPLGPMSYETLYDAYREQITYLAEAGADLLVAETMLASNETMVILDAAASVCDLPVFCTLTMEADGSLFFGGISSTPSKNWRPWARPLWAATAPPARISWSPSSPVSAAACPSPSLPSPMRVCPPSARPARPYTIWDRKNSPVT